jgi:hypothetical protein
MNSRFLKKIFAMKTLLKTQIMYSGREDIRKDSIQ